jgi:hypothetical protein
MLLYASFNLCNYTLYTKEAHSVGVSGLPSLPVVNPGIERDEINRVLEWLKLYH